jgi:two-component system cell cycle sensor histidine kinase/response regulator CckA
LPLVRIQLRRKLRAITVSSAGAAIFVACGSFLAYDWITWRGAVLQQLATEAEVIARQSTVSKDPRSARTTLEALTADPHVVSAAIYTPGGVLVASYIRRGMPGPPPRPAPRQGAGHVFASDRLVVFRPIESTSGIIGTAMIESDLTAMTVRLRRYALIALCVLVVSFPVSHWAASRLEGIITGPIRHLAATADAVSTRRDYSLRAAVEGGDEFGQLTLAFNHMLGEIQERDSALHASEEKYRLLFDANPNPMWVYDPVTLEFLAVNQASVRQYGYGHDEFLAMTIKEIRWPGDVAVPLAPLKGAPADVSRWGGLSRHRRKDGSTLDVEITASAITFGGVAARLEMATDVSEKKRLESQLRQAQKMEAIGRLAGGVAHDFNNLLGVITGYSELLQKNLRSQDPGQQPVAQIQKAADRGAALTRQLLAFSRKEVIQPKVLDLNGIVTDVGKMLGRLLGEDVHLVTKLGKDLGRVLADRSQIDQVILNLVVNARDAMPQGGDLCIETSSVVLDEAYLRTHADVRPGPYVLLTVSDTGHGMDAETLSHIFEPFFTTKPEGKGTGLGLATVFGIVKQCGGHVSVSSEPVGGTTFRVYLPRVAAEMPANEVPAVIAPPPRGTETVLLVEDAEALRLMIHEILEAAGYSVLESSDSEQAVLHASSYAAPLDLVLTDVVMPRMSGPDLVKVVQATRPSVKVLFMSGYTDEAIGKQGVLKPGVHFLQKPFTSEALLGSVRAVLDQRGQRA